MAIQANALLPRPNDSDLSVVIADSYARIETDRSPEVLRVIAHVKRFAERLQGDAVWREALRDNPTAARALFHEAGIGLAPDAVAPLWRGEAIDRTETTPTLVLWRDWQSEQQALRTWLRERCGDATGNRNFDAWRLRQARRMQLELDPVTFAAIPNGLVAYELSSGCSVGCWFCGVSAAGFAGALAYDAFGAALWHGVVRAMAERFGFAAATGLCYWATDPSDNPDFLRFLTDHQAQTGLRPQITTARPFASASLREAVLARGGPGRYVNDRFSVLTVRELRRIHTTWSAEDLLRVDLVPQMKGSLLRRASAGRAFGRRDTVEVDALATQGSIACITGFLVNLVERRVRLISPCRATAEHPNGYLCFGEGTFDDMASFEALIDELVARVSKRIPAPDRPLGWNAQVKASVEGGSVVLRSPGGERTAPAFPFSDALLTCLRAQQHNHPALLQTIEGSHSGSLLAAGIAIQELWEQGAIEEKSAAATLPVAPYPSAQPSPLHAGSPQYPLRNDRS